MGTVLHAVSESGRNLRSLRRRCRKRVFFWLFVGPQNGGGDGSAGIWGVYGGMNTLLRHIETILCVELLQSGSRGSIWLGHLSLSALADTPGWQ